MTVIIFIIIFPRYWAFVFVLWFYGPVNPMGSCWEWSVYLTTLLLGSKSLNQYCAHSFTRNWQLPHELADKGDNESRKYFMINLHGRMLPTQWGLNLQPPDHQSNAHPTESLRLALGYWHFMQIVSWIDSLLVMLKPTFREKDKTNISNVVCWNFNQHAKH